jgi:hypothetical protein
MKNLPIGPVALLAVVILLTAPVLLGIQLFQNEQGFLGARLKRCLPDDVACQVRDVARFAGIFPQLVGRLLASHQSSTKRGQT